MAEHAQHFLILTIIAFATIILVAGMKYLAGTLQARARLNHDGSYRELRDKLAAAQAATAATMAAVQAEMSELKTKLSAINNVLREVE